MNRSLLYFTILVFTLSSYSCNNNNTSNTKDIKLKRGYADLSNIDFEKQEYVELNGEWEFYWEKLLITNNDSLTKIPFDTLVDCPSVWINYSLNGKKLPSLGYATYRSVLKLTPQKKPYAINMRRQGYAYKLFINGQLITQAGEVGQNEEEMQARLGSRSAIFYANKPINEIVIQVSNYHLKRSGLRDKIMIGTPAKIRNIHNNRIIFDGFTAGICFIMFLYSLGMYWYRPKDKASLFFAFEGLVMFIRAITHEEYIIFYLFPDISFDFMMRLHYLQLPLAPIPILLFLNELFPSVSNKKVINTLVVIYLISFLGITINTPYITSSLIYFHELIILPAIFLAVYIPIRGVLNKLQGSAIILFGISTIVIAALLDMFNSLLALPTIYKLQISYSVFILTQALTLSQRVFNTEKEKIKIEQENSIIEEKNKELNALNTEIHTKTAILKKNYEKVKELTAFREEMSQMLVHDLKTPLNTLLNLPKSLSISKRDEIRNYSAQTMLNLVSNILDVSKNKETEIKITPKEISISKLFDRVILQQNFMIQQKNINIIKTGKYDFHVVADEELTERTFSNIISNALKYTPNNGQITLTSNELKNSFIKISIKDNGTGIAIDKLENIFEKYSQSGVRIKYSTGIGLTFCKMAVEKHGGTIEIESKEGKGTKVHFTLPASKIKSQEIEERINTQFLELSATEKEQLSEYIPIFEKLDLSQISEFRKIFKEIEAQYSINKEWLEAFKNSIYHLNEEEYKRFIKTLLS